MATLKCGAAAAVCVLPAGCPATKMSKALASEAIGCPVKEVLIADETVGANLVSFSATCRGVKYSCTYRHPHPASCAVQAR